MGLWKRKASMEANRLEGFLCRLLGIENEVLEDDLRMLWTEDSVS